MVTTIICDSASTVCKKAWGACFTPSQRNVSRTVYELNLSPLPTFSELASVKRQVSMGDVWTPRHCIYTREDLHLKNYPTCI